MSCIDHDKIKFFVEPETVESKRDLFPLQIDYLFTHVCI